MCVQITSVHPPPLPCFFISVRERLCMHVPKIINCAIFLRWQWHSKSSLHWRAPSPATLPSPPTTNTFFSFPPPLFSLPFLAQQESLEKKRGFYSASPCTPRHRQAFWNLSMPCQCASRVQLALCEDFLSSAAVAAGLPEAGRALIFLEGLSSHSWV